MITFFKKFKQKYINMAEPAKASLWYTICNVCLKGIALLATPIFTRILTKEQYGEYALFQSWYSIISIFATLNLFQSVYSKGLLIYEEREKKFTSSLLGLSTTLTLAIMGIYLVNVRFWQNIFEIPISLMLAMFVELIAMSAIEFWGARERFDFKYKKYVIVSLTTTMLSVVLGIISVLMVDTYKVEARVFADVFSKALFGVPIYIYIIMHGKKVISKEFWIYALKFNIPLIPHFLSTFVLNQADRIMIGKMEGDDKAAIYSIAYTIATMMILVVTAINNSIVPYIYKMIKAKKYERIKTNTAMIFVLVGALSIVTMMFAPEVIYLFAGAEYYDAIWIVPPVAASVYFIFVYSMFSTVEYYYQKTGLMALASMVSAGVNILLNYIFIKMFGYFAAGYTTLVSYILLSIFHYYYYKILVKKNDGKGTKLYDEKIVIFSSIIVIASSIIMSLLYGNFVLRYVMIVMTFMFALLKRHKIIYTIKSILSR